MWSFIKISFFSSIILVGCEGSGRNGKFLEPSFAKSSIKLLENRHHGVTTFVGMTNDQKTFVAVTNSMNSLNGHQGRCRTISSNSAFSAHLPTGGPLFVVTNSESVDLSSVIANFPFLHFSVLVYSEIRMVVSNRLFEVEIQKGQGGWKAVQIKCFFENRAVNDVDLRKMLQNLKKTDDGELAMKYETSVLNYVYTQHHMPPGELLYAYEETSSTTFLGELLNKLVNQGAIVVFEPK